jgi:hypothetical protein
VRHQPAELCLSPSLSLSLSGHTGTHFPLSAALSGRYDRYDPVAGRINAIFFATPIVQQSGGFSPSANSWEPVPLSNSMQCANFCDSDCGVSACNPPLPSSAPRCDITPSRRRMCSFTQSIVFNIYFCSSCLIRSSQALPLGARCISTSTITPRPIWSAPRHPTSKRAGRASAAARANWTGMIPPAGRIVVTTRR